MQLVFGIIQENMENADGFVALFFQLLESLHHTQLLDFVMTLRCIWKMRNDELWNDVETSLHISMHMAHDVLLQWQQVQERHGRREHGEYCNNETVEHMRDKWSRP